MLILMRRSQEKIVIKAGDDVINVNILGIYGNQVKIGVDAPRHIEVDREEIYIRKQQGGDNGRR